MWVFPLFVQLQGEQRSGGQFPLGWKFRMQCLGPGDVETRVFLEGKANFWLLVGSENCSEPMPRLISNDETSDYSLQDIRIY